MTLDKTVAVPMSGRLSISGASVAITVLLLTMGWAIRYVAFQSVTGGSGVIAYAEAICRWDCGWYVGIARRGYDAFPIPGTDNVGNWGFFPLYPLVVSAMASILPIPLELTGVLVSTALSCIACLVARPLLGCNLRSQALFTAFVLAGPFSIYFTGMLTEGLFLLLTLLVFRALQQSRYLAAGIASALLSATRIVGVFVCCATVMHIFLDHRRDGGRLAGFPRHLLSRPDLLLSILVSPAGLFAYMLHLHLTVGDAFAFSNVQRAFGRQMADPASFLLHGITSQQWSALAAVVGLTLAGVLAWRRHYGAALFCAIAILLPLSSGLASMVRYVAALAPLSVVGAGLLSSSRPLWLAALLLMLVATWFTTREWIGGSLVLV